MRHPTIQKLHTLRRPVVGAAVGSGLAAFAAESGGADLIMVLSAGFFRQAGVSSAAALLPYGNANEITWRIATTEVRPRVRHAPIILGICAQDPGRDLEGYLRDIAAGTFAGVTNFPSVGFIDGQYRHALEDAGLGFQAEVGLLRLAKAKGLVTVGFCFNASEMHQMLEAKVDLLCLDLGFADWRSRSEAEHQNEIDTAITHINATLSQLDAELGDTQVVIFGGPFVLPQDTIHICQRTRATGYVGGSTMERFPASPAIANTVSMFKVTMRDSQKADHLGALVGRSRPMRDLFHLICQVASTDAPVLIVGESGTGKEMIAREIHRLSRRSSQPMVCWNCAATVESLAMSELFGHERGAFTGADRPRLGKFEQAQNATLFMDELPDLPAKVQASLLRVLQEREIVRVGGDAPIGIDVRLIAASNRSFAELLTRGTFRQDLYHRLSTVVISVPPLRDRADDIPLLIQRFCQEFSEQYSCPIPAIGGETLDLLQNHFWPGNVRQLRNCIERAFIFGRGTTFRAEWVRDSLRMDERIAQAEPAPPNQAATRRTRKKALLQRIIETNGGNKSDAARQLGVSRKTVYAWLRESQEEHDFE